MQYKRPWKASCLLIPYSSLGVKVLICHLTAANQRVSVEFSIFCWLIYTSVKIKIKLNMDCETISDCNGQEGGIESCKWHRRHSSGVYDHRHPNLGLRCNPFHYRGSRAKSFTGGALGRVTNPIEKRPVCIS